MIGQRSSCSPLARLCVLASGSAGNCSVLTVGAGAGRHVCLIDAGLSPRRTRAQLRHIGLTLDEVQSVLLTHLDTDHWNPSWARMLPERVTVRVHKRHLGRAHREGTAPRRTAPFEGDFALGPAVRVRPRLLSHDALGVASFRIDVSGGGAGASLGFATDVGRVTQALIDHLRGVDVLAIESNYCPQMQMASNRPGFLKRRIMGGSGHLSNEQCAQAVIEIGPREHVVLLHLSRQCNDPYLVERLHGAAEYRYTITDQFVPTPWIDITGTPRPDSEVRTASPTIPPISPAASPTTGRSDPNLFA